MRQGGTDLTEEQGNQSHQLQLGFFVHVRVGFVSDRMSCSCDKSLV
jgi:hypothetical protein